MSNNTQSTIIDINNNLDINDESLSISSKPIKNIDLSHALFLEKYDQTLFNYYYVKRNNNYHYQLNLITGLSNRFVEKEMWRDK